MTNKLKTKIYRNMLLLSVIFILLSSAVLMIITYQNVERQIEKGNKADAQYLGFFIEKYGWKSIEEINLSDERRITIIGVDGVVLYDSLTPAQNMENHLERPEIMSAVKTGEGTSKRVSDTLSETSYYYAVLLSDGNVLRVATTSDTVYETFMSSVPVILIMTIIIIILAFVLSHYMTKNIVKPINRIDTSEPENIMVYDELAPFVSKIRRQNETINRQMKDLRRKKLEFETITENMNEGLIVIGKNGQVMSYNNSAIRLLNVNSVHSEEMTNILMFNRSSKFQDTVNSALTGKAAYCKLTFEQRVCEVMATPVMDNDKLKGAVILIIDVTEKEKRDSLRREFSANVSHELKTPLTSISGYAEIMKTGIVKTEDMVKFAGIIYTEAKRLIDLVGDIIKISKLDEEDIQLDTADTDIRELVVNIAARLQEAANRKNVQIKLSDSLLNGSIGNKNADSESDVNKNDITETADAKNNGSYILYSYPQIVDEIIYNIMDNAIKYNKDGGKVNADIEEKDEKIIVTIKDTGIGIPKEDLPRVFERFYRVDKSHSKSIGGTGLGLSIVKHGASFIGADVDIQSQENIGTTVTIALSGKQS